jgi:hypothetical protein
MQSAPALFLGRTTVDALYWLESMPEENTKVYAQRFQAAPGGPAMNAAITHALFGGQTQLVSAVGAGPWAGLVRAELQANRIALLDLAAGSAYETPLCAVLVNSADASRTIVNPPIATLQMKRLGTWQQEAGALGGQLPSIALTDGFFFGETRALLASLRDAGVMNWPACSPWPFAASDSRSPAQPQIRRRLSPGLPPAAFLTSRSRAAHSPFSAGTAAAVSKSKWPL